MFLCYRFRFRITRSSSSRSFCLCTFFTFLFSLNRPNLEIYNNFLLLGRGTLSHTPHSCKYEFVLFLNFQRRNCVWWWTDKLFRNNEKRFFSFRRLKSTIHMDFPIQQREVIMGNLFNSKKRKVRSKVSPTAAKRAYLNDVTRIWHKFDFLPSLNHADVTIYLSPHLQMPFD